MNKPAFNFLYVTDENSLPRTGTSLMLMYIEDIHKKDGMMMFTQMCDAGYRMVRENCDYNKWNQCIFEDIDYKFYIEYHNEFINPNILYEQLYEWLYNHYRNILYYSELSRHMNSFHFIFYFNTQRIKNNRMMCKAISDFIIKQAFIELGYRDIIEFKNVFDDCSDSFYQPCFLTLNNYHINNECDGIGSQKIIEDNYFSIKAIYDKLFCKTYKKNNKTTSNQHIDNKWDKEYMFDEINHYNGEYLNHHERYPLFKSIVGLCGRENEDMIKEEWENCATQLPEGNGHDTSFYLNEPYKNNWLYWIDHNEKYCYVDKELLQQFGYNIKFIKQNKDEYTTNKKINSFKKERIYL